MIAPSTNQSVRRAFTLMEVLLAMAVSAVVLAVINGVYFSALQLRNRTAQSFSDALPVQYALATIRRDLEGVLPPGGTLVGDLQTTSTSVFSSSRPLLSNAERVSPDFFTNSGMIDDQTTFGDVQRVAYYLADPEVYPGNAGRELYRVTSRNLLPATVAEPSSQWLMSGVEAVAFQYFDGTSWANSWDSTVSSNLPTAIKLQLVMAAADDRQSVYQDRPIELVVPLRMQAGPAATGSTEDSP